MRMDYPGMKHLLIVFGLLTLSQVNFAQEPPKEYKVVTIVESIVPGGVGRSRIIETKSEADIEASTTERTNGTDSKQKQVKRKDIKVDELAETKLLNFYSFTGINFQNIASNDAMIGAKVTELSKDGWRLMFMTSGVESNAGVQDGEGIFITRLMFSR
ncbi:MAG: hypothetical protein J7497_10505 [Chitinophagaceae bacterium]|nr:hypothetical protein [Chitinophagaceae bacterium]